jgi:hypothetical protein
MMTFIGASTDVAIRCLDNSKILDKKEVYSSQILDKKEDKKHSIRRILINFAT